MAAIYESVQAAEAFIALVVFVTAVSEGITVSDQLTARPLWEPIDDNQVVNWQNVNDTQTPFWGAVATTQSTTWQDVNNTQAFSWATVADEQSANWQEINNV